jgi:hypothetical protein
VDESPTKQISSPGLKLAWLVLGCSFVASLIASVTMIVRTINWIRLRGTTVPSSYTAITQLSEWVFGLSSAGLLILAVIAILRSYQRR